VIDPATGRWRTVLPTTTGGLSAPFWSPDGRSIIVAVG
jgi:Tol biopolymer transport system component